MTTRRKLVAVASILGVAFVCALAVPSFLRRAVRGTPALEYIRQHGEPTAVADTCQDASHSLRGLRLEGVRLYSNASDARVFAGRLLIYPDSQKAIQHFRFLPSEEPIRGERSLHYSQHKLFGSEQLMAVHVDAAGRVADVEALRYNWFVLWERPPLAGSR